MITKIASNEAFGDAIFADMKNQLDQDTVAVAPEVTEVNVASEKTTIATIVNELVKCAHVLEEAGHPGVKKVDEVLQFIETSILAK
jgi:hypothetical protein